VCGEKTIGNNRKSSSLNSKALDRSSNDTAQLMNGLRAKKRMNGMSLRGTVTPGTCARSKINIHHAAGTVYSQLNVATSLGALGIAKGLGSIHIVHSNRGKTTSIIRVPITNPIPDMPSNKGLNKLRWSLLSSDP